MVAMSVPDHPCLCGYRNEGVPLGVQIAWLSIKNEGLAIGRHAGRGGPPTAPSRMAPASR